jgi:hypothetical protein
MSDLSFPCVVFINKQPRRIEQPMVMAQWGETRENWYSKHLLQMNDGTWLLAELAAGSGMIIGKLLQPEEAVEFLTRYGHDLPKTLLDLIPSIQAKNKMTKDAANERAKQLAQDDPTFLTKTQRHWADEIGCSDGLINKLPFWRDTQQAKSRASPRNVGRLTKGVENRIARVENHREVAHRIDDCHAIPDQVAEKVDREPEKARQELNSRDETLEKLIADQEKDYEPSPLEKGHGKVKIKKQV